MIPRSQHRILTELHGCLRDILEQPSNKTDLGVAIRRVLARTWAAAQDLGQRPVHIENSGVKRTADATVLVHKHDLLGRRACRGKRAANAAARTLAAAVALCSTGCIPWVSTGYEVHGSGTKIGPGGCQTNYWSQMQFKLDAGATLQTEAGTAKAGSPAQYYVHVALTLKSAQSARFENAKVSVKTEPMIEPLDVAIPDLRVDYTEESKDDRLSRTTGAPLAANVTMQGSLPALTDATRATTFSFPIFLPFKDPVNFTLILPAIMIDNHRNVIAPVRFTYGEHPRVIGLACT